MPPNPHDGQGHDADHRYCGNLVLPGMPPQLMARKGTNDMGYQPAGTQGKRHKPPSPHPRVPIAKTPRRGCTYALLTHLMLAHHVLRRPIVPPIIFSKKKLMLCTEPSLSAA